MRLIGVRAQNFKKLRNIDLTFTEGLNVIVGDNWAGKTTLLQVITAALWGASVLPDRVADLPTWGQKDFRIMLDYSHEGRTFTAERSVKNSKITEAGKVMASGHTACNKFNAELFGLNFKDFCLFVLSSAGETAGALTFGATELQRRVEAFSGANVLDDVSKSCRLDKTFLDRVLKDQQPINTYELEQQLDRSVVAVSQARQVKATLVEKLVAAEGDLPPLIAASESAALAHHAWSDLGWKLQGCVTECAKFADRIKTLKSVEFHPVNEEGLKTKLHECDTELKRLREECEEADRLRTDAEVAKREVQRLEHELDLENRFKPKRENLERRQAQHDQDLQELKPKLADNRARSERISKQLRDGICPECGTPIKDINTEQLQESLRTCEVERTDLERQFSIIRAERESVWEDLEGLPAFTEGNEARLSESRQQLNLLDEAVKNHWFDPESLREKTQQRATLQAQLNSAMDNNRKCSNHAQKLSSAEQGLAEATEAKLVAQAEFEAATEVSAVDVLTHQDALSSHRELISEIKASLSDNQLQLTLAESELTKVTEEIHSAQDHNEQLMAHSHEQDLLNRLITYLSDSRTTYIAAVWQQILGTASHWLSCVTEKRLSGIQRTVDGEFLFEDVNKWTPIAAASGAQRSFLGVALRIGLSSALYGSSGLIILDEPTDAMGEYNSQRLAGGLMGLSGQVLMITHRKTERSTAHNVIDISMETALDAN